MSLFSSNTKNELDKLIEENDELKNTLHSFVQKHNNLTELEEKISAASGELVKLSTSTAQANEKLTELNSEIERKSGEKIELDKRVEEIDEVNGLYNNLSEKHIDLEKRFSELQTKHLELEETVKKLEDREDTLRASTALAQSNLEDIRHKINEAEETINEINSKLKTEETQKNALIQTLDGKISLSEEIKSNLETSIAALVGQLSEKEKMFTEFIDKRDTLIDELRMRQKEFDEHDYKFNYQRETILKLEGEIKQLGETKTNLTNEVRKLEIVKIELQDEIFTLRNDEERITESISLMNETITELENKKQEIEEGRISIERNFSQVLQKFTEEISLQKILMNSLRQETLDKEKELSSKEKLLFEKTSQIAEYGGLTKVLQKERAATEQLMQNLKEEHNELSKEYVELREKVNLHRAQMQQLKSESDLLETKKLSLEQELGQIISQSSSSYNNLDENKKRIQAEINSGEKEFDKLSKQISELKNELRGLKLESANVATQKEEISAKVSELIAMEKNLKNRIAEYQKKIESGTKN